MEHLEQLLASDLCLIIALITLLTYVFFRLFLIEDKLRGKSHNDGCQNFIHSLLVLVLWVGLSPDEQELLHAVENEAALKERHILHCSFNIFVDQILNFFIVFKIENKRTLL
jgi:hypothetical protein